jgi:hypothetical protein
MTGPGGYRRYLLTFWWFLLSSCESLGVDGDEPYEVPCELALIAGGDADGDLGKPEPPLWDGLLTHYRSGTCWNLEGSVKCWGTFPLGSGHQEVHAVVILQIN